MNLAEEGEKKEREEYGEERQRSQFRNYLTCTQKFKYLKARSTAVSECALNLGRRYSEKDADRVCDSQDLKRLKGRE